MRLRTGALLAVVVLALGAPVTASLADGPPALVNADPSDLTPHVLDGQVNAIVQVGGRVLVGGSFTQVQQAGSTDVLARASLFAYDAATGAIDPTFAPVLDGDVRALAADGATVFVGGTFSTVNGVTLRKVAKLSADTGAPVAGFTANANAVVQDLALRGGWLYASGKFVTIRGVARAGLARLNPATGAVDPGLDLPFGDAAAGTFGVSEIDLSPDGAKLLAVGNFRTVGGQPRSQLAMLNVGAAVASVTAWQTDRYPLTEPGDATRTWCMSKFDSYLRDAAFSPDGSWFAVVTAGGNRPGKLCDTAARFETVPATLPAAPTWVAASGGDTLTAVTVTDAAVYVGGHQQYLNNPLVSEACGVCQPGPGAVARAGIAALDPLNGLPYSWNPGRTRGNGVYALVPGPDGLFIGSDTDRLGGERHGRLGLFPSAGGVQVPPSNPYPLPGDLYAIDPASGALLRTVYNPDVLAAPVPVPGSPDLREARGAFALNGRLYTGTSDGTLTVRSFTGSAAGAPTALDLHGLDVAPDPMYTIPGTALPVPSFADQLRETTGMFADRGRLYYTVAGDPRLYYRWFTPESGVVGAELFVAATGEVWGTVRGMTMAFGTLLYATADGSLWRVAFDAANGPATRVGGPDLDGTDWSSRGLFAFS